MFQNENLNDLEEFLDETILDEVLNDSSWDFKVSPTLEDSPIDIVRNTFDDLQDTFEE